LTAEDNEHREPVPLDAIGIRNKRGLRRIKQKAKSFKRKSKKVIGPKGSNRRQIGGVVAGEVLGGVLLEEITASLLVRD
jgi:hypothetical protein